MLLQRLHNTSYLAIKPLSLESITPSALDLRIPSDIELYNTRSIPALPYQDLLKVSKLMGIISVIPSSDGSIRQVPLLVRHRGNVYPSLALMTACRSLDITRVEMGTGESLLLRGPHEEIEIPTDSMSQMLVNYTGDMMSFGSSRFSFNDVYESIVSDKAIVPLSKFKDKVVIIGISDLISSDTCSTPFEKLLPGAAVHAMAVDTILQRMFLDEAPGWLDVLIVIFFASAAVVITASVRPWITALLISGLMAALWSISYISFNPGGLIISFLQPVTGIILASGGALIYGYMREIIKCALE